MAYDDKVISLGDEMVADSEALLPGQAPRRSLARIRPLAAAGLVLGMAMVVAGGMLLNSPRPKTAPSEGTGLVLIDEQKNNSNTEHRKSAKTSPEDADKSEGNTFCREIPNVILDQDLDTTEPGLPLCSAKWSEECRQSGCCQDAGMNCYEKDDKWAACNTECKEKDDQNSTWTCKQWWPPKPRTWETCSNLCKESKSCQQAIFSADGNGDCKHSNKSSTKVVWAGDAASSLLCATSDQAVEDLLAKVNDQLPFYMPPPERPNCSWAGEDCSQTKCCKEHKCTKDFSNCWGLSCYKKTEYFSGCVDGEPGEDWDGKWVGGAQDLKEIAPAGAGVAIMGTSLYCFMVVAWDAPAPKPFWSTEKELVGNIKDNGLSIINCDGHRFYDGVQTARAEWGSFSNIDAFMETWKAVEEDGNWKNFDWTVKVDSDAIFFPDRLKQHLDALKVPAGARVYVENNDFRFKFMGALEVISKPAVEVWVRERWNCIRGKHEGGEDFFTKGCLDTMGIDHMVDHALLVDTYAGQSVYCTDGWAAAFHYHKSIIRYNWCYNEAVCGARRCEGGQGLEVEYVQDED